MNARLLTAPMIVALLSFGTLSFGTGASAMTITSDVQVSDSTVANAATNTLYIGAGPQSITLPLSAVGGTVPSNLLLSSVDLPSNVALTLNSAAAAGDSLVLSVSANYISQAGTNGSVGSPVNSLANVTLISGASALTVFQVPVQNAAAVTPLPNPGVKAISDGF